MSEVKVNKISPRTNCGTVTVGDSGDSVSVSAGVPVTVNNNLTVSGDLKSAALKAVDGGSIISQCGTNITLGASGDTINLAAGATQTGFGRTGTVDWDTTAKTASFTAVSGNGYFVNTTSGAVTLTLPSSPSAGDIVSFKDYAYTFATNNLTVAPNGSNIGGDGAASIVYNVNGTSKTFIYVDGTQGWLVTNESTDTSVGESFVAATGGTITTIGDYKIHAFTGPGTFCVTTAGSISNLLVVAGGGGGGRADIGAGGGAGGLRNLSTIPVTVQGYPITVGGGGSAQPACGQGNNGSNSLALTYTSAGGGGGGGSAPPYVAVPGSNGGSGGGGANALGTGGSGNTPPVSPSQGNDGGPGATPNPSGGGGVGGGGGGATAVGGGGPTPDGGNGGAGLDVSPFFGTAPQPFYISNAAGRGNTACGQFAGGGGGAGDGPGGSEGGEGGVGGGGKGSSPGNSEGFSGTTNSGGGGGGGENTRAGGGAGGSGIVLIKYKFQ